MQTDSKLVLIPTYNEIENIGKMIRYVRSLAGNFHILVIDDGSPDGTGDAVRALQSKYSDSLFILQRTKKEGLGMAYKAGFRWALEHGYEFIFEMDADFSHDPDDLQRLYQACAEGADVAIGSRYCNGIRVKNWPLKRILISYGASFYVRSILWVPIFDSTAGFVCYRAKVLRTIDLDKIEMRGYGFQIEMKYTAARLGFKLQEVPILFKDRTEGTSKMSSSIFGEAFWGVLKLRFRRIKPAAIC